MRMGESCGGAGRHRGDTSVVKCAPVPSDAQAAQEAAAQAAPARVVAARVAAGREVLTKKERKKMKVEKKKKHQAEFRARMQAGEPVNRNRAFIERLQQRSDSPLVCEYCGRRVVISDSGCICDRSEDGWLASLIQSLFISSTTCTGARRGESLVPPYTRGSVSLTGARAEAWCLLIHADASHSLIP